MNPISVQMPADGEIDCSPSYLFDYSGLYKEDARKAGTTWFRDAVYGLGVNFGLHSLLGKGERALADGVVTLEQYRQLAGRLDAKNFDVMDLVQLAVAGGMRYISFTVRGADGFSLYNSGCSDFNCTRTPAKRDFLGELASVCEYHGVGLCLRYSLGTDWSRPEDALWVKDPGAVELGRMLEYQDFVHEQIREMLTQYGPIAAICFDGVEIPWHSQAMQEFGCQDLYNHVHYLQPQVLVSFNHGLLGTEDFFSCVDELPSQDAPKCERGYLHDQPDKPVEIQCRLSNTTWGYHADQSGKHLRQEDIVARLRKARQAQCNLMVNTALMPDGSIDFEDMKTLLAVGELIEKSGYPGA